jgi:plasmid maintenance system antidote protein VapI
MEILKLKGKMVEKGCSPEALAEKIGVDRSTIYRKLGCGEKFTIGEAQKIKNVLDLSNEEATAIFFD